jgi:glucose/arabinose dehydrogenase
MYVVHTRIGSARDFPANELVRFRLEDGIGVDPEVLLSVPITTGQLLHNGGNVHFGPDGFLYITFGDNGEAKNSQDLTTLLGKINRYQVTDEGLIPAPGNPFGADNPIFAYGLRNPFDFTFDSITGRIFASEVGPSCDDEIDWIRRGFNYGWREDYKCVGQALIGGLPHPYQAPMLTFTPVEAPTGLIVYDNPAIPEWYGNLFFCNWIFGDLRRVVMNEDHTAVEAVYDIDLGGEECRIDLAVGPEGGLYFGTVSENSGAIMRLLPAK